MFFLLFVLGSSVVWGIGLLLFRLTAKRVALYCGLAVLFVVVGLVVFSVLSNWAGILSLAIGDGALVSYSVSFPLSYVNRGALGVGILGVGVLVVLSPLLAAWLINRQASLGLV